MSGTLASKPKRLTDAELSFQQDNINWMFGPTFDIRFYCAQDLEFEAFEQALFDDPMYFKDARFDSESRLLLWHEAWTQCVGGYYYDFAREDRREPSLVFYPRQYRRVGGDRFEYRHHTDTEKQAAACFVTPLVEFAHRIKSRCKAHKVLLFLEDSFAEEAPDTEVRSGVYLAREFLDSFERL